MFDLNALAAAATQVVAEWTPKVLGAAAVLVFGWMFAGRARKFSRTALAASRIDDVLIPFLSGMIHVSIIVMVGVTSIGVLGISTASFVAVLGAVGLAIALAFQGTFSNFAAGIMLLTFRPFEVGDFVDVGGESGTVREVGIFSCVLHTSDNIEIRVPNSQIFGSTIKNFSTNDTRRIDIVIGVGYEDDLGVAIRTCLDVLAADARVLDDPSPFVAVAELGESSVNLCVRPWVARSDFFATKTDLLRALKENLEAAGCTLPYPQRDVHLHEQSA